MRVARPVLFKCPLRPMLLMALAGLFVFGAASGIAGPRAGRPMTEAPLPPPPVFLYFGAPDGRYLTGAPLVAENADGPLPYCRRIVEALIAGPDGALLPTIPEQVKLRAVFIDGRTAWVDFSRELSEMHPGGVRSELLTVYSIVNTLVLNMDDIDRVKILIEGNEAETLAGHIAIDHSLTAQMLLVR